VNTSDRTADFVVVGGGTAGAVVARRLADAGAEVILIEAGPSGERDQRVLTLSRWDELIGSELDWDVTIEPQERGNELIRHSRAKVLGGCSSHNTSIAFEAPDWDLDEWERLGAAGWGPTTVRPYYDKVRERVNIEDPDRENACVDGFLAAASSWGLPRVDFGERNVRRGAGWFKLSKRGTRRDSSATAYLFPLAGLPDTLTLITDLLVTRIVVDDSGAAHAVETNGGTFEARQEVILTAGAFGSPKLLLLSGIGPAEDLHDVGIPALVDRPGVGEHLIDHPEGIVLWEATRPMVEVSSHWESGLFTTIPGSADFPELMAHFTTQKFDDNTVARGYPTAEHTFSMHPNVTRARSAGTVRLRNSDPREAPLVDPRYYTDADGYDEHIVLKGIQLARELAQETQLSDWIARELAPGPEITDVEQLSEYARMTGNTVYHPAGTCRMGPATDEMTVVDPECRVVGVSGLRVADASVFPCMTTVNPMLTVMMIGERCADLVLSGRPAAAGLSRA
jgi:choline oxidase